MGATLLHRSSATGVGGERRVGRSRRHFRIRKKISGTAIRPRLVVTRSLRHIYAQLVDDTTGHTLASASTLDAALRNTEGDKKAAATKVGELLAQHAKTAGISTVIFDRGGNAYHGRIAALADAARAGGLEF